ncbi:beta-galactosidase [Paenibacillus mesotrionivorans]|uniref:Beta-galactosidase n=1 Tax=Paenibacillus mesotrionivorans TaxID=3160968 RepID=A0ACC7NWX3_9BACL
METRETIRIGSQLFINKEDTPEQVRRWVCQMGENGLLVIRLFMVWEQLEPEKDKWEFANYDACFDQALECGLAVVPTLMSGSPPGWMHLTDSMQELADLDDPSFEASSANYIDQVVKRYRDHPAMDSWILWNEPTRVIGQGPHGEQAYVRYLEEALGSITAFNAVSYRQFRSFTELAKAGCGRGQEGQLPFRSFAEQMVRSRFSVHNLCLHLAFIRDRIRRLDTRHPVHINPHNLQRELQHKGQSIWREAELADFLGCSAHPMWHSLRFPGRRWGQSVAFFADLMKSATLHPAGLFWVTELQGGTTLYSSSHPYTPSGDVVRQWIWEGLGSGARAVVFWCFNSRSGGYEGGEWSLLNQLEQPSPRLEAARETAELLKRHGGLLELSTPEPPQVLIVYSEASCALGEAEGQGTEPACPRNKNMYMDAIAGAWLMCSDLSIPVIFRNEERFVREPIPDSVQAVLLPNTIVLGQADLVRLELFAKGGGVIIADGLCGMKDAAGNIDRESLRRVAALFGAAVQDIETDDSGLLMTDDSGTTCPGWFYRLLLALEEESLPAAWFEDGRPAVSLRALGTGRLIRVGTIFFQSYFANPDERLLAFFGGLIESSLNRQDLIRLDNGSSNLRLRRLAHPQGAVVILINTGQTSAKASLLAATSGQLIDLATGRILEVTDSTFPCHLEVEGNGTEVWFFRRNDA